MESDSTNELVLRDLTIGDYHLGYLSLLSQLTTVGEVTEQQFTARCQELASSQDYCILVIEDTRLKQVVGTASLVVEKKFIHGCGKVGHVEDVVVCGGYRGKKLGQRLIEALIAAAKDLGCYKVILDCAESNVPFYEKCGLQRKEVQMVRYLDR